MYTQYSTGSGLAFQISDFRDDRCKISLLSLVVIEIEGILIVVCGDHAMYSYTGRTHV